MAAKKTDLRVVRTLESIRRAFYDMIVEMDYEDITVKELVRRARINRNTFYLHFSSLDALLDEMKDEIARNFIAMFTPYETMDHIRTMIRNFVNYLTSLSPLFEKILCSGSYRGVAQSINEQLLVHRDETLRGSLAKNGEMKEEEENIVFAYCGYVSAVLFRQWVRDGKKLSPDELADLAERLICHGMESVV